LDDGAEFREAFAKLVALHVVAEGAAAAAIICKAKTAGRLMLPGERPNLQADRAECVVICAEGRMGTPVDMLLRIIGGHTVPPPIVALDGEQTVLGFGRFVSRLAPSPAERAAAQALLKQLAVGDKRFEGTPQDMAKIAAYNPSAKPPQW